MSHSKTIYKCAECRYASSHIFNASANGWPHFIGAWHSGIDVCNDTHRTCNAQQLFWSSNFFFFRRGTHPHEIDWPNGGSGGGGIKSEILGTHQNNLTAKMSMVDSANNRNSFVCVRLYTDKYARTRIYWLRFSFRGYRKRNDIVCCFGVVAKSEKIVAHGFSILFSPRIRNSFGSAE